MTHETSPQRVIAQRVTALDSLTSMRFVAAVAVFLCHMSAAGMFADQHLNTLIRFHGSKIGLPALEFFFVLSGFVLTWSARPGDTWPLFWRRRMAKIYPNHFVTWIVGYVLMVAAGKTVTAREALPGLLLVQAWFPDRKVLVGMNGPSWSLCVELTCYLAFPWLIAAGNRIRPERLWRWALVVALVVWVIPAIGSLLPNDPQVPLYGVSWWNYWFVNFLPTSRAFEFMIGILVARMVMTGQWPKVSVPLALLAQVPGYALVVALRGTYFLVAPMLVPLALLVGSLASSDIAGRRTILTSRFMMFLGEISFAFYLVHMLVANNGPTQFGTRQWGTTEALARIAASFGLSLLFGWALCRLVEIPFMRRWSRPRVALQPAVVPSTEA